MKNEKPKKVNLATWVSEELHDLVVKMAYSKGMNPSEYIREALREKVGLDQDVIFTHKWDPGYTGQDVEPEPQSIECSSFEDVLNKVANDHRISPVLKFVECDDPKRLRIGWSNSQVWLNMNVAELVKTEEWANFWTPEGRREFISTLNMKRPKHEVKGPPEEVLKNMKVRKYVRKNPSKDIKRVK